MVFLSFSNYILCLKKQTFNGRSIIRPKERLKVQKKISIILGTLVGSLTSPDKFMAGASAGVYALIGIHLIVL